MKPPKVTARKYFGDDAQSWAVFVNGIPFVTGLSRREVPHYKTLALAEWKRRNGHPA